MTDSNLIYGLNGLMQLLNCSHATAHKYKSTVLAGTYAQIGRKIVFNKSQILSKLGMVA